MPEAVRTGKMMDGMILKQLDLENQLQVTLIDRSKKLIGDRYQVILEAEMRIPVDSSILEGESLELDNIKEIQKILGNFVVFQQRRQKTFVDQNDKDSVLKEMVDTFVSDIVPYVSRPDFAVRLIKKQYAEKTKRLGRPQSGV